MPHLVQMNKKYSKKGMVLIGAEVQGSAEDKINEIIDEHKVQFTVTKGIIGPNLSNSIPHMAVFATNGDLVFNGHPNNAEKAIKIAKKTGFQCQIFLADKPFDIIKTVCPIGGVR